MITTARSVSAQAACARLRPSSSSRTTRSFVVRAAENGATDAPAAPSSESSSSSSSSTVFYAGSAYSESEWSKAVEDGVVAVAPAEPVESAVAEMSIADLMAFSGPAPEIINGRLAMLAFVSALFAELSSGETVVSQFKDEPTGVLLTFVLFASASLIPMIQGTTREAFGPLTPKAEELNGRAAMIGFAALLIVEGVKGSALF